MAFLFIWLAGVNVFAQAPNLKMPLEEGYSYLLTVEPGGATIWPGVYDDFHTGTFYYSIDFDNPTDSCAPFITNEYPFVVAAASGTVKRVFTNPNNPLGGYGYGGEIDHGNGYTTIYGHCLDPFYFSVGESIVIGENLCIMGSTGNSTGSHLHFEYRYNGVTQPINFQGVTVFTAGQCYTSGNYIYNSTQTCEYLTGPDANWNYYCNNIKSVFDPWDDVQILAKFTNLVTDHRFKIEAYRNGYFAWDYTTGWNIVGSGGWDSAYFYPSLYGAIPGSWSFNISIDDGGGFTQVDIVNVEVPLNQYYTYNWTQNCSYITGPDSNWHYYCGYPTNYFTNGWDVPVLIKISSIYSDYRFKVYVYKDNVYQWTDTTSWTSVGAWGWNYAYFNPVIYDATVGTWNLYIYIDDSDDGVDNYDYLTYSQFYVF